MTCSAVSVAVENSTGKATLSGRKQLEVLYAMMLDLQYSEGSELVILRTFSTVCAL